MTIEAVNDMLKSYRFEVGRCGHIQAEINSLERQKRSLEHDLMVAMVSPRAQQITDMPHGTSVGNPTERYAMRLVEGIKNADVDALEAKIGALHAEYQERYSTVQHVESWLNGLTDRERWIVETQIIDGTFWKDVCCRYRAKFGEDCSKDTLKRCRDRALDKIYEMAK